MVFHLTHPRVLNVPLSYFIPHSPKTLVPLATFFSGSSLNSDIRWSMYFANVCKNWRFSCRIRKLRQFRHYFWLSFVVRLPKPSVLFFSNSCWNSEKDTTLLGHRFHSICCVFSTRFSDRLDNIFVLCTNGCEKTCVQNPHRLVPVLRCWSATISPNPKQLIAW